MFYNNALGVVRKLNKVMLEELKSKMPLKLILPVAACVIIKTICTENIDKINCNRKCKKRTSIAVFVSPYIIYLIN